MGEIEQVLLDDLSPLGGHLEALAQLDGTEQLEDL